MLTWPAWAPGRDVGIAVDLAANEFHRAGTYVLGHDGAELSAREWTDRLCEWCDRYPIVSLEDVLYEDDWAGWQDATRDLGGGRQLIGDDLFATDVARLEHGIASGVANAILVKPNQAGTVSRTAAVLKTAQLSGYATVVSARSGDTEDYWLADLAVGWNAGQIKVGAPSARSGRRSGTVCWRSKPPPEERHDFGEDGPRHDNADSARAGGQGHRRVPGVRRPAGSGRGAVQHP